MFSRKTYLLLKSDKLYKVAIYGGVFSISSAVFFTYKIQDNFRSMPYYQSAVKLLQGYQPAIDSLGQPIKTKWLKLGRPELNNTGSLSAKLAIPVYGPKDTGMLYVQASREDVSHGWTITELDIELKKKAKRWTFYRDSVPGSEKENDPPLVTADDSTTSILEQRTVSDFATVSAKDPREVAQA